MLYKVFFCIAVLASNTAAQRGGGKGGRPGGGGGGGGGGGRPGGGDGGGNRRVTADEQVKATFRIFEWLEAQRTTCANTAEFAFSDIVGEVLRYVGHDFMSDFKVDNCFDVNHVENKGLQYSLSLFHTHAQNLQLCPRQMSDTDCAVLIAEAAMSYTAALGRPGLANPSVMNSAYPMGNGDAACAEHNAEMASLPDEERTPCVFANGLGIPGLLNFEFAQGRRDTPLGQCDIGSDAAMATHTDGSQGSLPNVGGGGPPVGLADTLDFAEIHRVLGGGAGGEACDFTDEDVAAIMGVHTVGRARTANSNFEGTWVNSKRKQGSSCVDGPQGCEASVFDNQYYKDFFTMGWRKKADGQGWECIPNSNGVDIHSLDEEAPPDLVHGNYGTKLSIPDACWDDSLRLNADMIIMFDLKETDTECRWVEHPSDPSRVATTCALNHIWGETLEYAESDEIWLRAFRVAWKKMVDCGHSRLFAHSHSALAASQSVAEGNYFAGDWVASTEHSCQKACSTFDAGGSGDNAFKVPVEQC